MENEIDENPKKLPPDINWTHFKLPDTVRVVPGYYEPRVFVYVNLPLKREGYRNKEISKDNIEGALIEATITALDTLHKEAQAKNIKCGFVNDLKTLQCSGKGKDKNTYFNLLKALNTKISSNCSTPEWIIRIAQNIYNASYENLNKLDEVTTQMNHAYQRCLNYQPNPLNSYPDHYKDMLKTTTGYDIESFFQDYCNPTAQGGNTHKLQFFLNYKKWSRHHLDLAESLVQEIQDNYSKKLKILENYRTHLLIKLHNEGRKPANSHLLHRIDFALEKLKLDVQPKIKNKDELNDKDTFSL